jgi:hypothetical protein
MIFLLAPFWVASEIIRGLRQSQRRRSRAATITRRAPPVPIFPPQPNGPSQRLWHHYGYQQALRDIARALQRDGLQGVRDWLHYAMRYSK